MGFIRQILFIAFIAWLFLRIAVLFKFLLILGLGNSIFNHVPGSCKIFHVNGSEDIDVLPSGIAVVSSGLKYITGSHVDPAMHTFKGKLYAFNLNNPDEGLDEIILEGFDKSEFVPHGIDFYTDPATQETYLFVVNHGEGKESIEIFEFYEDRRVLKHRKTVTDKNIYFPNDVVAVGPDSFYVTNDHYFSNPLVTKVEVFYPLKLGNVVFYNGTNANIVATHMRMPNGINLDKTGKYVYVVDCVDGTILVFKREEDNSLKMKQEISLGFLLDNVFVDENDDLWTAGAAGLSFLEYNKNFSKPCPGKGFQVKLSYQNDDEAPFKVDDIVEVYSTRGDGDVKAASSAVFYKGKLLIGSPFSNLMYCTIAAV